MAEIVQTLQSMELANQKFINIVLLCSTGSFTPAEA